MNNLCVIIILIILWEVIVIKLVSKSGLLVLVISINN